MSNQSKHDLIPKLIGCVEPPSKKPDIAIRTIIQGEVVVILHPKLKDFL
jgi:hypothetical protein